MSKKLESNAEFVHILYLHKLSEEFLQKEKSIKTSTEYVYDVLTRGFLFNRSNPEPLVLSESIVSKYGIDNLVANLQRKFRNL